MQMANAAVVEMDTEEFLRWCLDREGKYELVEGRLVTLDPGEDRIHDCVLVNLIGAFGWQLRDRPCRPTTAAIGLLTGPKTVRRPDMMITCDPPRDDVYDAIKPRLVVEIPWERKLMEYRRHPSLDYILLVDSKMVAASLYVRTLNNWEPFDFDRFIDVIEFPNIDCRLGLATIYEDTRLVEATARDTDLVVPEA
jgi:Uma2 family endonuclease